VSKSKVSEKEEMFFFDESTATHLSAQPLLRDPYESLYSYTKKSTLETAGEGLFARRDLPKNVITNSL
jgi:hypothetical protein